MLVQVLPVRFFAAGFFPKEFFMSKRHKLQQKKSEHLFSKTASKTHVKNVQRDSGAPMRGGIRL